MFLYVYHYRTAIAYSYTFALCVCVGGLVRTYIRGQFCVFNHLTGDVRQVGRPRMFLQVQSTSYHILNMFDIFNAYFKN